MFSRVAIVSFVVAVAEYVVFQRASAEIGVGNTVFVVAGSMMVGFASLRAQFARLAAELAQRFNALGGLDQPNPAPKADTGKAARATVGVVGCGLLIVPGLLTSAVGLAFLIPAIQSLVAPLLPPIRLLQSSTAIFGSGISRRPRRAEDGIVDVDVVSTEGRSASSADDDDPPLPPGVHQAQP